MHPEFQYDRGAYRSPGLAVRKNSQLEQILPPKHFFKSFRLPLWQPRTERAQTRFAECRPHNWKRSTWDTCLHRGSNPKANDSSFSPSLPTTATFEVFTSFPWGLIPSQFENCCCPQWFAALIRDRIPWVFSPGSSGWAWAPETGAHSLPQ